MSAPAHTSIASLSTYLRQAQYLGLDIQAALDAAGLDAALLGDHGQRIPCACQERVLEHLIAASADPLFGLHAARFVQPGSWSVLGYITMNCATLGAAMSRIVPYEKLVGEMGSSHLEMASDHLRLSWNCRVANTAVRRHVVENVLASWLLYARWLTNSKRAPREVWFEHERPAATTLEDYQTLFDCPVRFAQTSNALLVPLDTLNLPLRQADTNLLRTLEEHALALMARLEEDEPLPRRVKNALRLQLKDGLPRKDRVAEQFAITVRTLQRHLQQAGTSYQQILDELRQELAEHYLQHSDLAVQDIASYLGFSEARSFHRCFKSWTGQTPGEFREMRRGCEGLLS